MTVLLPRYVQRFVQGLLFFLVARLATADQPALHRVAYDDAGAPGRQPQLVQGESYTFPLQDVSPSIAPEDDSLRTVAFGPVVRFGYSGIREGARYMVRLAFLSDGPRAVRISVDACVLQERLELPAGQVVRAEFPLESAEDNAGETMLEIRRLSGPNAVVSEVEVLSTDSTPLAPLKDPGAARARRLAVAYQGLPAGPPQLSPRPERVAGVREPLCSLDGQWRFTTSVPVGLERGALPAVESWNAIRVPGEWVMQGFSVPVGSMAYFARTFELPTDWNGKRIKLRFDCVHSICRVWVNGHDVGEHEGGFVPFEFDITAATRPGENQLCVGVQSESVSDTLASMSQYAAHQVGGLLRKVTLFALPEVHLTALVVTTPVGEAGRSARLCVGAELAGESNALTGVKLRLELFAPDGQVTPLSDATWSVSAGALHHTLVSDIPAPQLWDPEHPRLYRLRASLVQDDTVLQVVTQRVGFRQVEIRGNQLLVNSRPVKLLGVCRHEVHPLLGRSLTAALCRQDAEHFRGANCNYVRTSHYPPSEEFLNACDELGLLVESEAALCWVGHGANPIWQQWDHEDPRFLAPLVCANEENVLAGRDHPCVILWSLGNESRWNPLWLHVQERVRRLDPTRPTTFHDQCWGEYNNARSAAPVAVYHYPGEDGPAACDREDRPVLFGEYAHVQCYNRRELVTDPGVRDDWGRPLERMVDLMQAHPGCLGGAIWSGIDDTFHVPDGRIIGYGPWGPLDGWRRTKPEYWHLKKAYTPVRVFDRHVPLRVENGRLHVLLENRYNFTDLSEVRIDWTLGAERGVARVELAPRTRGSLEIRPQRAPAPGDLLNLAFTDPRGFVCESESLAVGALPRETSEPVHETCALSLTQSERAFEIVAGDMTGRVDRGSGRIVEVAAGGAVLLVGGPTLMVLPLNSDSGGSGGNDYQNRIAPFTPTCDNWRSGTVRATLNEDLVEVRIDGAYDQAKGAYTLRFRRDGSLDVSYSFEVQDDVNPRQWGVVLDLPVRLETLRWKRRAQWTTYPPDHIGRPVGDARADGRQRESVEEHGVIPTAPWSLDTMDLGCNDFRSTKYDICRASLTAADGGGLQFVPPPGGPTSLRAWVENGLVRVLVAGFHTGGSDGFYAGHFAPERRALAAGKGRIEGSVTVRAAARERRK